MPCVDNGPPPSREEILQSKIVVPALCGILTVLENCGELTAMLRNGIDWRETGITEEELIEWWNAHKKQDQERRERERKINEQNETRKIALSKLTPEERKSLGL